MTLSAKEKADLLRKRLLEDQEKKTNKDGDKPKKKSGDNASYEFWNMKFGETARVRFLPDGDDSNPYFWVDRAVCVLPFSGIVGGEFQTDRGVTVTVPCMHMFGEKCPIVDHIRPWWKDESKKDLARTYYKKLSHLYQGFVMNSPFAEDPAPENPIRRFIVKPQLHKIIEAGLMDPEMDHPADYVGGTDFNIKKTQNGEHPNYTTSGFARNSRALSENELIAIDQFKLFNLKDFLGRKPDKEEVEVIKQMLHDSLDGKPFDHDSYGEYYRAYVRRGDSDGYDNTSSQVDQRSSVNTSRATKQEVASDDGAGEESVTESVDNTPAPAAKKSAADVLERLRAQKRNG